MDLPVIPDSIFDSALASMQQRCEARKREDEALQLCLPRKAEPRPAPALSRGRERWAALTWSAWVRRTILWGYRLQFAAVPLHFSGVVHSQAHGESARVLQEKIHSLLSKGAICVVPSKQNQSGLYSRYFLDPKRGGTGIRPILDLQALNKYLKTYTFRMLTHASLL